MNFNKKYYGIKFPFKNSEQGFYFDLTTSPKDAVKSNLFHLLVTRKGSRLYKPEFGTRLMDFLFEPMDNQTFESIQNEIIFAVQTNLQGINIDKVDMTTDEASHSVSLDIKYSYNEGLFVVKDVLNLTF